MDNWTPKEKTGTDICPAGVYTMEYATTIAKDQNNIFLSATITGNLQLIRLEHIIFFVMVQTANNGKLFCVTGIFCNGREIPIFR